MYKILLIDGDTEALEINQTYLQSAGFEVYTSASGHESLALVKMLKLDCIVMEAVLPGTDGFELCRNIRSISDMALIFLSTVGSEEDRIKGLTSGADDYLVKPCSLRELKVRIDTVLRRTLPCSGNTGGSSMTFGTLTVDPIAHRALCCGRDLMLTNREFELLLYFCTHPNRDLSFEELGIMLFGFYQESDRQSVMVVVSRLRKKLEVFSDLEGMIETVRSKGYHFYINFQPGESTHHNEFHR